MTTKAPTQDEISAAQDVLNRAAAKAGDTEQAILGSLVTSTEFTAAYNAFIDAQRKVPANTELSYAISMMARLATNFTPR